MPVGFVIVLEAVYKSRRLTPGRFAMSPSPHVTLALLSGLLFGIGMCHSASVEKLRIARDTRNIPSNMFKPVNGASNGNQNTSFASSDNDSDYTFSEHSTGEAHAVTGPVLPNGRSRYPFQSSREEDYDDRLPFRSNVPRYYNPNRSNDPSRDPFPSGLRTSNFESHFNTDNGRRSSGFNEPEFGSSRRLVGQTIPLMATGIAPSLIPSGLYDNDFGQGSSNNFFRSESYSYTSDGNGPPQVERNVFDSRLGHGQSSRNF
ncbi:uncharacterized protein LOC117780055 [Drosophila innubila]|uniref:uncharacterized protein LOC117780055 n=1 Tax=Drosophila innubila TaxID=198719 RepID=UPI00148C953C|nr:uncharacterized protein LOC117780055 [Drosophila innubila]